MSKRAVAASIVGLAAGACVVAVASFGTTGSASPTPSSMAPMQAKSAVAVPAPSGGPAGGVALSGPAAAVAADIASAATAAGVPGYQLDRGTRLNDGVRDLDVFEMSEPHGSELLVTVYRKFNAEELRQAGFVEHSTSTGTVWIGAADRELQSVYFRSSAGAGVHIVSIKREGTAPLRTDELTHMAEKLMVAPNVVAEVAQ